MTTLDDVDALIAEIAALEATLQERRSRLQDVAKTLLVVTPSEEARHRVAALLYWHYPEIHALTVARGLFGPSASRCRLEKVLPTYPSSLVCAACGAPLLFTSRKALNEAVHAQARKERGLAYHGWLLACASCQQSDAERCSALLRESAMTQATKARLQVLRTMPYADYLRTPEWRATAERARRTAGYHCQVCNSSGELHVHHRTYVRRGAERDTDLFVLCAPCHRLFHTNGKLKGLR